MMATLFALCKTRSTPELDKVYLIYKIFMKKYPRTLVLFFTLFVYLSLVTADYPALIHIAGRK